MEHKLQNAFTQERHTQKTFKRYSQNIQSTLIEQISAWCPSLVPEYRVPYYYIRYRRYLTQRGAMMIIRNRIRDMTYEKRCFDDNVMTVLWHYYSLTWCGDDGLRCDHCVQLAFQRRVRDEALATTVADQNAALLALQG